MAIKRKAVAKNGDILGKRNRTAKVQAEVEERDVDNEVEDKEMGEEVEEEHATSPEETEKEIVAARTKELKAMYIDELKQIATKMGLDAGKKEAIIKGVISHEAQERATVREKEEKVRDVVTKKKEEFESLPAAELKQMCAAKNIAGVNSKQTRVEELLKQWLSDDGVEKALAKLAQDAREIELKAMDVTELQKLCVKVGVNPFVKEVMVDRIIKCEGENGCFSAPVLQKLEEQEEIPSKKGSLVESLLASESQRKKELELKQQQEEAAAKKFKEFQGMSIDNLKKALSKKGQKDVTGKKDDLVKLLFGLHEDEEKLAAKKAKLQAMALEDLKKLVSKQGLPLEKNKEKMIVSLITQEGKLREAVAAHERKVQDALAKKKEELEKKTGNELKDLCASKGLPVGTGKDFRIDRLLEESRASGEADSLAAIVTRSARIAELHSFDIDSLHKLCGKVGAEPLMKDVMVERIIAHESTFGPVQCAKK